MSIFDVLVSIWRGVRDLDSDHERIEKKIDALGDQLDDIAAGLIRMDAKLDKIIDAVVPEQAVHLIVSVGEPEEQI